MHFCIARSIRIQSAKAYYHVMARGNHREAIFHDNDAPLVVEGGDRNHYQTRMDYIHLNPVRARIIQPKAGQSMLDYPWSSLEGGGMLKQGLKASGIKSGELERLKGSDARKLLLADLLWRRTTVSQAWLAEHLSMKSAATACQQLRRLDRKNALARVPAAFRDFLDRSPGIA